MKIPASVRRIFEVQRELNASLMVDVDLTMRSLKDGRWHYESRLKEIQSFLVKLETGRVRVPEKLEDFLACTIVVPNTLDIKEAYNRVLKKFEVKYRRPRVDGETAKPANAFPFDDLRLYLTRQTDETLPPKAFDGVVFELQIKTFLQHAWSIATHDFNYKTDEISWGKDRIVAHLKASIEHVELSLHEAKSLSTSNLVALSDARTTKCMLIVELLKSKWAREDLPPNIRGLADALEPILAGVNVTAAQLDVLLQAEKDRGGGILPLNLSPYGTILQVLLATKAEEIDTLLRNPASKVSLLVTPEVQVPTGFPSARAARRVVTVK
ncbi:hypothetical protein ACFSQQ_39760 [Mesorhizobium kowhaii]|uniref:hypothetical protein n=1 Tax=Mesorhizobium kowhaii TaxID=1300272 RepID=UPI0035EF7DC3